MKEILFSKKFVIPVILVSFVYVLIVTYLMNWRFVEDTLWGSYPMQYKLNIMVALLIGLSSTMTKTALAILVLTAILTGINLTLIVLRFNSIRGNGKLHFMVGGSSVISIVGSGCAVCGLPILSLLGLSGSLVYLPFQGQEISVTGLVLLCIASYYLFVSYSKEQACKIN